MSDLISRQAVIKLIHESADDISKFVYGMVDPYDLAFKVGHLPSAESQRKKGKWIRTRTMTHDGELYCSECEQEHPEQKIIWNFCPNCGADMREIDGKTESN